MPHAGTCETSDTYIPGGCKVTLACLCDAGMLGQISPQGAAIRGGFQGQEAFPGDHAMLKRKCGVVLLMVTMASKNRLRGKAPYRS